MPTCTKNLQLIALNCALKIRRADICRLGEFLSTRGETHNWKSTVTFAGLDLPKRTVERAQKVLEEAAPRAKEEIARANHQGIRVVTLIDSEYPKPLLEAPLPPPVLYVLGRIPEKAKVSIVGSRHPDDYGREAAHFFGRQLALRGVTIVSGFARGIDEAAHRGALSAPDGKTLAVLGCGIDIPYPRYREALVSEVSKNGGLISEFPMGTPPLPRNFPIRNRIIAALGRNTTVIQAAPRSGSLITARYALEIGRDVFALPGRIFDESSLGPNALLRDGAAIALHPEDLLEGWHQSPGPESPEPLPPLNSIQSQIWSQLPIGEGLSSDQLAISLDLKIDQILCSLLDLELGGWVRRHPGPKYSRIPR